MEDNTTSAQAQTPASSGKRGFWKGFFIGVAIILAIGLICVVVVLAWASNKKGIAQTKGRVASAALNLSLIRSQAELSYDTDNGSYAGVCKYGVIADMLVSMKTEAIDGDVVCNATKTAYAIAATMKDTDGIKTLCVDSDGTSITLPGNARANITGTSCLGLK